MLNPVYNIYPTLKRWAKNYGIFAQLLTPHINMIGHSYLSNADVDSIDDLYLQYQENPTNVEEGWQRFFEGFDLAYSKTGSSSTTPAASEDMLKEINVLRLINEGYRTRGHFFTKTNPVRERRSYSPNLEIKNFGLVASDLDKTFNAGVELGIGPATLRTIIDHLEATYCQSIGVEFMYIPDPERKEWLRNKMETSKNQPSLSIEEKREMLRKLNQAVVFEHFLHTKYVGQKRFSLEGLETLIPALDSVIELGSTMGIEEYVIGMAHRGRLNVLANIMNKSYEEIFSEFEGKAYQDSVFEGDVKYHMGYSSNVKSRENKDIRLTLSPNPSHLESVNPVVGGIAKAKLDGKYNNDFNKIAPILIHGDASIAGQGIVYETIQMAGLEAYNLGGTIHIVTNNQIGFTTNYVEGRTSIYCTDVAKTTKCPVFHVNGDDVEAIVYTIKLAMEYRQRYNMDVFIDLLGYRKYGHNEGDEPRFTQPNLYKAIAKHKNPREIYTDKLAEGGSLEASLGKEMEKAFKSLLQDKLDSVRENDAVDSNNAASTTWSKIRRAQKTDFVSSPTTAITKAKFIELAHKITSIPADFKAFKKVEKLFNDRAEMVKSDKFDWAMGELMAYASLVAEGHPVRMSGQDCERGTFSHRHAVLTSEDNETEYVPLQHVSDTQARFEIYNSLLSEFAVLGFEYGYAMSNPEGLTLWEAQFGDFANGAQVIIDQYIASGEAKWQRYNGMVLLLPHGSEGQGPEHSSARPERYLQLCAKENMQVINPTTPANLFHALRRQLKRDYRVPLIVLTPKSLLRHALCTSTQADFTTGGFKEVVDDEWVNAKNVKRVVFCNGKVYYDLLQKQQDEQIKDVAVVRIEQLYPLPEKQLQDLHKKYPKAEWLWVQEEPKNQGAWTHLLRYDWPTKLDVLSRKSSSSPATGYAKVHAHEQGELLRRAFDLNFSEVIA
ncbi:MAG: 2-oxoglutarate dehydrogenase E1 component [Bacteroidia bacterium]|jgi:2-oxoglutarate dehydrogenase E1 component